jgi:outer membrane protein insertion porin family
MFRGMALVSVCRFALTVGLVLMAGMSAAQAQSVVVHGNQRMDAETIRSYVQGKSPDEARQALLATGMFSDVKVAGGRGATVVTVNENLTVNRVVFEGNKKLNKDVLAGELATKARGPYSPALVQADVEKLQEIYKRGGRGMATISSRTVPLTNGRVDVVFTIKEGDKTGVKEIIFVGNQAYSSRRLRDLMTTTEMNLLSWLKTSDVYDPDKISSDEELIRRYYLKNGYADFRIVSTDAVFDQAKGGWIVTITVEEGQPYRISTVDVESRVEGVTHDMVRREVTSSPGEIYDAENVEKALTSMTTSVMRRGNPFVQVRPAGVRDSVNHTIGLTYVVEEGPRVYIERINVRGNVRTRDYVIRRELDLEEGDAYNKVLIDRAERRLNGLGYFKKVRITNEPGSQPDRVVINIDVEDQSTGQFSVSGGYSTQDGVIGEVAVAESNFLGRGQYIRVAGQLGQRTNGVQLSFTEPYFLGQRLAAGFDVYTKYTDNTMYARYETRATGGTIRFGFPITDEFTVTARYSLYQTKLSVPDSYKQPYNDCSFPLPGYTSVFNPPFNGVTYPYNGTPGALSYYPNCAYDGEASVAVKQAIGRTLTSLVGVTLTYNTLDNMKNPHSGIYAEVRPEIAGLGGDSKFFRATGEARYYRELWDDVVGIVKLQGGTIQPLGGNDLRLTDNFFLGPSLVRGFAPSGIGPRDLTGDPSTNAIGGVNYFGASVEAQFPIWGLPRELGLKGAVFADAGTLFGYKGAKTFDLNYNGVIDGFAGGVCQPISQPVQPECMIVKDSSAIRTSVGASILWQSPLGPIRFDYAFALTKADGDRTQAFRFSGGGSF